MRRPHLAALSLIAALSACGGGGGGNADTTTPPAGNAPVALTAANYTLASQEAMSASLQINASTGFVTGADTRALSEWTLANQGLTLVLHAWNAVAARAQTAVGAVRTETVPCENSGGSMVVTANDANGNNTVDSGDTANVVATNCVLAGNTANGTIALTFKSVQGNVLGNVYTLVVSMTMTNFATTGSTGTFTGNGPLEITLQNTAIDTGTYTMVASNFSTTARYGSSSTTRTLTSYTVRNSFRPSGSSIVSTISFDGTLQSTGLDNKTVTVATVTPFTLSSSARYPSAGQATLTGANGSKARITAQNTSTVLIELDADGNGTWETSTTKAWSEIL